jgi:predicted ferric reductase
MKKIKGLISIFLILIVSAFLWYIEEPLIDLVSSRHISLIIGGVALTGFCLVFFLSTRLKWMEKWFHGLENVYAYHKYLAIFSVSAVFLHGILMVAGATEEHDGNIVAATGLFAFLLFVILTLIALIAKRMKYEKWRFFHRLMVIPYGLGLYHTYIAEEYDLLQLTPLSIWMGITTVIGVVSAVYVILFYQRIGFRNRGKVTAIKHLTPTVMELELTLDKKLLFEEGQYVFLKIKEHGFEKAPHPFSISCGDGIKIYLAIKTLGDHTEKIYGNLKVGTKISLDGPYGHMIFSQGGAEQKWIAGGIGIAPFISYLRNNKVHNNISLYYSYRGEKEAVYKEFLDNYAKKNSNFDVKFIDTSKEERLDVNSLSWNSNSSVYMCGPAKMIKKYNSNIKRTDKNIKIIFEAFDFR